MANFRECDSTPHRHDYMTPPLGSIEGRVRYLNPAYRPPFSFQGEGAGMLECISPPSPNVGEGVRG